jgi:hypothetical protein
MGGEEGTRDVGDYPKAVVGSVDGIWRWDHYPLRDLADE